VGVAHARARVTALDSAFAEALLGLIGPEARALANALIGRDRALDQSRSPAQGQAEWEEHQIDEIRHKPIDETEKSALILARRGQGVFKQRVRRLERRCRITGVERIEHLRASHCKPWRDSDDAERLDGENGLLLTPTIDHLLGRRLSAWAWRWGSGSTWAGFLRGRGSISSFIGSGCF
jgi:hypothetical protein